ncbi:ferritin-like domain-containing protein [Streptomonospora sediminis]
MSATPKGAGTAEGAAPSGEAEGFGTVSALQAALRAEHAAVYAYSYIGANSGDQQRERCYEYLDAHRAHRDTLRTELHEQGAKPDPGQAVYEPPESNGDADLDAYARRVERQTEQAYLELAASPDIAVRDLALRSLQEAVLRGMEWGVELPAFPGFPRDTPPEQGGG